jgi:radical SAM protein with 4Fe4S-binding SPASM domain
MRQITRLDYFKRHLKIFVPYATPRKVFNLLLNTIELRLGIAEPRSFPPYMKIEPTSSCHLSCPGCAHSHKNLKRRRNSDSNLTVEQFESIVDSVGHSVLGMSLSLRGEPLLNKDLPKWISYANSQGIATMFPTNLSLQLKPRYLERLVASGLDAIFVSLDGASRESYEEYRVGGDFQLVLDNVKRIVEEKKKREQIRPMVIWKFVVFDHNKHEVSTVRKIYRSFGFDGYELVLDYGSRNFKSARKEYRRKNRDDKRNCYWAWHTTTVRCDGEVTPCCRHLKHDFHLGNVRQSRLSDIWRGAQYCRLRSGFRSMDASSMHPVCAQCLRIHQTKAT